MASKIVEWTESIEDVQQVNIILPEKETQDGYNRHRVILKKKCMNILKSGLQFSRTTSLPIG